MLRNIFIFGIWLLLEVILILTFTIFLPYPLIDNNVRYLDIVACSVVLALFFLPFVFPLIQFGKDSKGIGSLGIRIQSSILYALGVVLLCVFGITEHIPFVYQFWGQLLLFALLMLSLLTGSSVEHHVSQVYKEETRVLQNREIMKTAIQDLVDTITITTDLSSDVKSRILSMEEQMRFISPNSSPNATALELEIVELVKDVKYGLNNYEMNKDQIEKNLTMLQQKITRRKNINY